MEPAETLTASLALATAMGTRSTDVTDTGTGTITDNDTGTFTIDDVAVVEDVAGGNLVFTISLDKAIDLAVS